MILLRYWDAHFLSLYGHFSLVIFQYFVLFHFTSETNLALGKPAYQSGQWRHYVPNKYVQFSQKNTNVKRVPYVVFLIQIIPRTIY